MERFAVVAPRVPGLAPRFHRTTQPPRTTSRRVDTVDVKQLSPAITASDHVALTRQKNVHREGMLIDHPLTFQGFDSRFELFDFHDHLLNDLTQLLLVHGGD